MRINPLHHTQASTLKDTQRAVSVPEMQMTNSAFPRIGPPTHDIDKAVLQRKIHDKPLHTAMAQLLEKFYRILQVFENIDEKTPIALYRRL
jgi:hypothetical protein